MIKNLLTKVKLSKQLSTKKLQRLKIGSLGSEPIYHPMLLDLLHEEKKISSPESSQSLNEQKSQNLSPLESKSAFKKQNESSVEQENTSESCSSEKVSDSSLLDIRLNLHRNVITSAAPTLIIDLSIFVI